MGKIRKIIHYYNNVSLFDYILSLIAMSFMIIKLYGECNILRLSIIIGVIFRMVIQIILGGINVQNNIKVKTVKRCIIYLVVELYIELRRYVGKYVNINNYKVLILRMMITNELIFDVMKLGEVQTLSLETVLADNCGTDFNLIKVIKLLYNMNKPCTIRKQNVVVNYSDITREDMVEILMNDNRTTVVSIDESGKPTNMQYPGYIEGSHITIISVNEIYYGGVGGIANSWYNASGRAELVSKELLHNIINERAERILNED